MPSEKPSPKPRDQVRDKLPEQSRTQVVGSMVERLQRRLVGDLQETVQWFHRQMPTYYFQVTDPDEQERHLEMLHSFRHAKESRLTMVDDGLAGKLLVFGRPQTHTLLDVVRAVGERPFHRLELH